MARRELTILAEDVASSGMLIERQHELMHWLCARGYFDLAEDAAAVLATLHSIQADHVDRLNELLTAPGRAKRDASD